MRRIGDILAETGGEVYSDFIRINTVWVKAMTKNIAEVTTPYKLSADGALSVLVRDNIWHTELNYMKSEIMEKLAEYGLKVTNINFKYRAHYEKVRKIKRPAYEITQEKQIYIEEITKNINNNELKELFAKAMTAYFKRYSVKEFIDG